MSMRGLLLLLLLPLLLGFASAARNHNNKNALLLSLRGGSFRRFPRISSASSLIELNPNYEPPPHLVEHHARQQHDDDDRYYRILETTSQQSCFSSSSSIIDNSSRSSRLGLVQLISSYATRLQCSSPELFAVSAACLSVFVLWQIPACHGFLERHFVCRREAARRPLGILLSAVSHSQVWHLAFNLATLLSLGPKVQQVLGNYSPNWNLWPLLAGAAVSASTAFLALNRDGAGAMGLSGVTMALLAVYAKMFPQARLEIRLAGIIPVRLLANQLLQVALLWSFLGSVAALSQQPQGIAHAAHLGGLLFGMGYYELWSSRHRPQFQTGPKRAPKLY